MSNLPFYIGAFLLVIGVLIAVHEYGHYLAARFCGVKVLRFSLGFGPVIWQREFGRDRTQWAISLIPLGGYVKMLDEREGEVVPEELHRAFNRQGVGVRSLIVAAGPLFNFVLAIAIYWMIFMAGSQELLPIFGPAPAGTAVAEAGIVNGEQVRLVDGEPVATWDDLRWSLLQKAADGGSVELEVINERHEISRRHLDLRAVGEQGWEGDALQRVGVVFYRPHIPPVLGQILPDKPGERAGLQTGDRVVGIDGAVLDDWFDFVEKVSAAAGRSLRLEVERGNVRLTVDVIPEAVEERGHTVGKIGVGVAQTPQGEREVRSQVRYGFLTAGRKALGETWEKSVFTLVMMGKMLTGEVSWRNISGPVTIADYAGRSAKLGADYYLKFMALVSISLGVLNLLPVPVLDGGHLLYHMLEVVRRRPLSERAMEIGQRIGLSMLLALMTFAIFNDVNRLFTG